MKLLRALLASMLSVPFSLQAAGSTAPGMSSEPSVSTPAALPSTLLVVPTTVKPLVEAEEDVYTFTDPDNGSGPLWCSGSSCLVRSGDKVIASGIELLPAAKKLNNCRWTLFERTTQGWQRVLADPTDRTREPSPLAVFPDGQLFLSANPTLVSDPQAYSGPARPEILRFTVAHLMQPPERLLPVWDGTPAFTEHSYRSFAADGPSRELILFQNVGYTHAEWAFRDKAGNWAQGKLRWPEGKDYEKPQPIRVCYPNVALRNRAENGLKLSGGARFVARESF